MDVVRVLCVAEIALLSGSLACSSTSGFGSGAQVDSDTDHTSIDDTGVDGSIAGDASDDTGPAGDTGIVRQALAPPCFAADAGTTPSSLPPTLSATRAFTDIATKTLNPALKKFTPKYVLWSDGAVKTRWVLLPDCSQVDVRDMDHWSLPVGTTFFKEFDSPDGRRLETRLIQRFGPGPDDFNFGAYAWRDDESDADFVPYGRQNVRGTDHDIPSVSDCKTCHGYLPERALGFGAIQLSHSDDGGITLAALAAGHRLNFAPEASAYAVPGDSVVSKALGYLHANCSHCHNPVGVPLAAMFSMRVKVGDRRPEDTDTYKTGINAPVSRFIDSAIKARIKPGDPGGSCIFIRMSARGSTVQMPPLATEVVDDAGAQTISAWISQLK